MFPLHGLAIKGYRSYYHEFQYFGPLKKINLLAGQNNAGKSNVIRFAFEHLKDLPGWTPGGLDRPRVSHRSTSFAYALGLPPADQVVDVISGIENVGQHSRAILKSLLSKAMTPPKAEGGWLRFAPENGQRRYLLEDVERLYEADRDSGRVLPGIRQTLYGTSGGGKYADEIEVLDAVSRVVKIPNVKLIQSFRQIGPAIEGEAASGAGPGLIEALAALQNPDAMDQDDAEAKYGALNEFVSSVFDQRGVRLEVPANRRTINVRTRNNVLLPLENQGTGIHQVIMIAAIATTSQDALICIEEPEVNLHPVLQRRLLKYLDETTNNQYVIATHSAQMLDYERGNVFHLTLSEEGTKISPASTPAHVARVCSDLGYRASDLLQCNAVIWVEGPSDRTYVNHWLTQAAPDLEEGIHYSIMFYGGSILSELVTNDPIVSEFINLRRLNRNVAILIDSDRTSKGKHVNRTKARVRKEIEDSVENGYVWITDGYTIENYVPQEILLEAVRMVHPRKSGKHSGAADIYTNPLGSITSPDKSKIAKAVVSRWSNSLSDRSLRGRVGGLVDFIHRSNVGMLPQMDK